MEYVIGLIVVLLLGGVFDPLLEEWSEKISRRREAEQRGRRIIEEEVESLRRQRDKETG